MIVFCKDCRWYFDDEYRSTICGHETFAANDGKNNFAHHPEAYLKENPPWTTHHIWCNEFMGPLIGCDMCPGLYHAHPYKEGDTEDSLMARHFPNNKRVQ